MSGVKQMSVSAEIKALKAKVEELKKQITSKTFDDKLTVKVGDKGTLNIYGLAKFPVCLYPSQLIRMEKLITSSAFKQFVIENNDQLVKAAKESKEAKDAQ